MTTDDLAALIETRRSLHALAEHVVSPVLYQATGKIGLRACPGGFGTPPFPSEHGLRSVHVDGTEVVDSTGDREERSPIPTVRTAASFVGIEAGAPTDVYTPTTRLDLDAALVIDTSAAKTIADWYELVDAALAILCAEHTDEDPAIVQLWPEHFDLATTITQVNYGGSPGDEGHPAPYLYVGPWSPPPPDGAFWNQPYGASLAIDQVASIEEAVAFFREGVERSRRLLTR